MCKEEDKEHLRNISNIDQNISLAADTFPVLWWKVFEGCKAQGFNDAQAMELLKTFIHGNK